MAMAVLQAANQTLATPSDGAIPEPMLEYASDPVGFFIDVLGERPWKGEHGITGQMEWLEGLPSNPYNLIFAGTGPGKTWLLARTGIWFLNTRPNSILVTVATTWDQVVNQLWREIRSAYKTARVPLLGKVLNHSLEISEKWYGIGLSPRHPESLAGYHAQIDVRAEVQRARDRWREMSNAEYFASGSSNAALAATEGGAVMLQIDEASGVEDELHDAGEGITTGPGCFVIKSGNLTRTEGRYYQHWVQWRKSRNHGEVEKNRVWFEGEDMPDAEVVPEAPPLEMVEEEDKDAVVPLLEPPAAEALATLEAEPVEPEPAIWRAIRWTAFDAPARIINRDWIERLRRDCGRNFMKNPRYLVRALALPPLGSDRCIFPLGLLEDCADIIPAYGGRHIGVDLGFGGGDPCVAVLVVNGRVSSIFQWNVTGPQMDVYDTARVIFTLATGCTSALEAANSSRENVGWNVPMRHVHVDATGAGQPVVDIMRRAFSFYVDGVNFGGKPENDWVGILGPPPAKLLNRRHELHWIAMRLLQEGLLAIPDRPEYGPIWSDLSAIQLAEEGMDGFAVEKKTVFIKREGHSPDHADATLLACSRASPDRLRFGSVPRQHPLNPPRRGPRGYLTR
jgi:hypothetical protein